MPVARIVGGIGRVLITAGLVLLLFVAYQLWGTGLAEARAQDDLRDDFAAVLAAPPSTSPTTEAAAPPVTEPGAEAPVTEPGAEAPVTTTPTSTAPTTTAPVTTAAPRPPAGAAVAIIRIPRIGLDKAVVEGVTVNDLKKGPGHYPRTPLPGEAGNAAIAGHRTTYGAPFGDLGKLEPGDEILVTTRAGEFRYVVDRTAVVSPSQVEVLDPTTEARLTLTTCHPKYTARQRLVVSGVLVGTPPVPAAPGAPSAPDDGAPADDLPGEAVSGDGVAPDEVVPGDEAAPGGVVPDDEGAAGGDAAGGTDGDAGPAGGATLDDPSLAGDPTARVPAAAWAGLTALVALAAWAIGRRWRRWPTYVLALPFGALALFQCFEQVARLFPANV